ncbi:uncharacterized protein CMC5_058350 [Chondromyces crocatus]|uniref:Uncharacterized protein n=1 Tax=Chondromyces crocatus TaxID=52 RepID=A0A0K1EM01_CHOCO|nr:uncharacterized protein CMC5_058350 [Chondromyces crocatus]
MNGLAHAAHSVGTKTIGDDDIAWVQLRSELGTNVRFEGHAVRRTFKGQGSHDALQRQSDGQRDVGIGFGRSMSASPLPLLRSTIASCLPEVHPKLVDENQFGGAMPTRAAPKRLPRSLNRRPVLFAGT